MDNYSRFDDYVANEWRVCYVQRINIRDYRSYVFGMESARVESYRLIYEFLFCCDYLKWRNSASRRAIYCLRSRGRLGWMNLLFISLLGAANYGPF